MIIYNKQKFIEANFNNEQEIEDVVIDNAEHFFGASSVFLPKRLIRTRDGSGTIPDGFVIDIADRIWYVVEVELLQHRVWDHIAPQITKQIIASSTSETRKIIEDIIVEKYEESSDVKDKFEESGITTIHVRKEVRDILFQSPIVGLPIDKISQDLRDWANTLKNDVKLWLVKKYVDFNNADNIVYEIPEEYKPVLDTVQNKETSGSLITFYDVSLSDLVDAELLDVGEILYMNYKPRGGDQRTYEAVITEDGNMELLGHKFKSPSYAAVLAMNDAGSNRTTANGWKCWKTTKGKLLAEIREENLNKNSENEVSI